MLSLLRTEVSPGEMCRLSLMVQGCRFARSGPPDLGTINHQWEAVPCFCCFTVFPLLLKHSANRGNSVPSPGEWFLCAGFSGRSALPLIVTWFESLPLSTSHRKPNPSTTALEGSQASRDVVRHKREWQACVRVETRTVPFKDQVILPPSLNHEVGVYSTRLKIM